MLALGSLAFVSPWLLAALAALPMIWWLLRVTPPAPRRIAFPAIRLLLGLVPREETPARTPLWLILLRIVLAALVILALAHPLLNPQARLVGDGPMVLVVDDGWTAARDWSRRQTAATDLLAEAEREDRKVVLVTTAPLPSDEPPPALAPIRAADARAAVQALQPKPWPVDRKAALARARGDAAAGGAARPSGSATGSRTAAAQALAELSRRARQPALSRRQRRPMPRACSPPSGRRSGRQGARASWCARLPATEPRLLSGAGQRRGRAPARARRRRRSAAGESSSRCGWRCRPSCATG